MRNHPASNRQTRSETIVNQRQNLSDKTTSIASNFSKCLFAVGVLGGLRVDGSLITVHVYSKGTIAFSRSRVSFVIPITEILQNYLGRSTILRDSWCWSAPRSGQSPLLQRNLVRTHERNSAGKRAELPGSPNTSRSSPSEYQASGCPSLHSTSGALSLCGNTIAQPSLPKDSIYHLEAKHAPCAHTSKTLAFQASFFPRIPNALRRCNWAMMDYSLWIPSLSKRSRGITASIYEPAEVDITIIIQHQPFHSIFSFSSSLSLPFS